MIRTLTLAASLAVAALSAPIAAAAQGLNIVVMGEDADEDTVPRGNRVFNRVIQAMTEEMNVRGFDVFDETAIAMDISVAGQVRRTDAELIELARAVQTPPLDVMTVFQIYASVREGAYTDIVRPDVRIAGRLLNVRTGQAIGTFEVDGLDLPPLPVGCERECLLEEVGDSARILGAELADALTTKLENFVVPASGGATAVLVTPPNPVTPATPSTECGGLPTAYVMRFDGFEEGEMTAIEEYVNAFSCVRSARPVRASTRSAEYWYETTADSARLNRNLRLMFEHMGVESQLRLSGNTFVATKVATR